MAYEKIIFKDGDVVTASMLNHVEDGIKYSADKLLGDGASYTGLSLVGVYKQYKALLELNGDFVIYESLNNGESWTPIASFSDIKQKMSKIPVITFGPESNGYPDSPVEGQIHITYADSV